MNAETRAKIQEFLGNNQHAEAIPLLESVCSGNHNDAEAYYLLGCSYARLGQHQKAADALQRCIELAPNVAQSHFALAGVRLGQGLQDMAAESLKKTLSINNSMAEAHIALADIEIKHRNFFTARQHLTKAIDLKPNSSEAHLSLARLEQEEESHESAIKHIKKAIEYKPDFVQAHCAMANSIIGLARMSNKRNIEDAIPHYKKALSLDPNYLDALSGLATLYEFTGQFEMAYALIEPSLKEKTYHAIVGLVFARLCRQIGKCDEALQYIDKVLEKPDLSASSRKTLLFAAAKVLDNIGKFDAAFSYYKSANETLGPQAYDTVSHAQTVDNIIKVFNPSLYIKLPKSNHSDRRPIFIVGMPRSGTTLTEQILAVHSKVFGAGELVTLAELVGTIPKLIPGSQQFPDCVTDLRQEHIDMLSRQYLEILDRLVAEAGATSAVRITDKMPHNFFYLGLIQLLFPEARVIHCQRDPVDTCLSIYCQDFNERHDYAKDLFKIGTHYSQYQHLMEHWGNTLTIPMYNLKYEELVANQKSVTKELIEFCGLDWEESCLYFHKLERTVNTPSYDQVRQPLYNKSIGKWRHYEKYLQPLMEGLQRDY